MCFPAEENFKKFMYTLGSGSGINGTDSQSGRGGWFFVVEF